MTLTLSDQPPAIWSDSKTSAFGSETGSGGGREASAAWVLRALGHRVEPERSREASVPLRLTGASIQTTSAGIIPERRASRFFAVYTASSRTRLTPCLGPGSLPLIYKLPPPFPNAPRLPSNAVFKTSPGGICSPTFSRGVFALLLAP